MSIENVIGKPVVDHNFFGRDTELAELQAITEREHVLLLAPRRVGKTSLLHALVKRVEQDGSAIGVYTSVAADERLEDSLGGQSASIARALLEVCARDPEGAPPSAMLQVVAAMTGGAEGARSMKWIVDVLANDGYLVEREGRWRFRSGLLRCYWVRHAL